MTEKEQEETTDEVDEIKCYEKAGKITSKVREESKKYIKIGAKLLDIANRIEEEILKEKAGIAFPVNISLNENAAHDTPSYDEERVITNDDVVKIDIGVHVEGYIGDSSYTLDFTEKNGKLLEANQLALENAISMVKPGAGTQKIGEEIQKTIEKYGFKPIENLTGHGLEPYMVHAEPTIPNIKTMHNIELEENQVIALEPFASTGQGRVREAPRVEIFSFEREMPTRNMTAREIMNYIAEERYTLPFAERWLIKNWPAFQVKMALRELTQRSCLISYPTLHDVKGCYVSQFEHTMLIEKDGVKVLTK